ncbi:MAG: EMC3/TMCO1 family protein [Methanothermobacter sp.]|nr:EMC3/TMCO1 family protein [Methanothermobacter sp.]
MVLDIIYNGLDIIFGPFLALDPNPQNPILTIFIIATIIAFIITLANKLLVDQERLQELRREMQEFQQEVMEARKSTDIKALEELQEKQMEFMDKQREMMTMSFKPMIVTFLPIILVFYWMAQHPYISKATIILPQVAYYVLLVPIWHMFYKMPAGSPAYAIGWLGWYILCSFAMSQIFRKFMGLKGM